MKTPPKTNNLLHRFWVEDLGLSVYENPDLHRKFIFDESFGWAEWGWVLVSIRKKPSRQRIGWAHNHASDVLDEGCGNYCLPSLIALHFAYLKLKALIREKK